MGIFQNVVKAKISGNVGSMNFRERQGQVVVAERVYTNNSKGSGASEKQRMHRSRLANIVNFFKVVKAIEAQAWEGKPANTSDFNMLSKYNLAKSPIFLTKQEAAANASVIAAYEVSRGNLEPLDCAFLAGGFKPGIVIASDFSFTNNNVGGLSGTILENNAGWQNGDKLSIALLKEAYKVRSGIQVPVADVTYIELTLDTESTQMLSALPNFMSCTPSKDADGNLYFASAHTAGFAIHSRKAAGYLETSSQSIVLKTPATAIYTKYTSEAQKLAAMDSYGYKGEVLLTPGTIVEGATPTIVATISSVKYDGNILADGATIDPGKSLVITGEDMNSQNVVVYVGGVVLVPQTATATSRSYTPNAGGQLQIFVNAVVYKTVTVNAPAAAAMSIKFGGQTYTEPKSNLEVPTSYPYTLEVSGENLGELSCTGGALSNVGGSATKRTATFTTPSGNAAPFTISVGSTVIISGTTEDEELRGE